MRHQSMHDAMAAGSRRVRLDDHTAQFRDFDRWGLRRRRATRMIAEKRHGVGGRRSSQLEEGEGSRVAAEHFNVQVQNSARSGRAVCDPAVGGTSLRSTTEQSPRAVVDEVFPFLPR